MKIALYIEDGLEQIVLTPQSDTERAILGKLHDGSRELQIKRGSFFDCRAGYTRFRPEHEFEVSLSPADRDESTMIVLTGAKPPRPPPSPDPEIDLRMAR